jgi:uncharacterized protein (TIGR00106 family)
MLLQFTIIPLDKGMHFSPYVARVTDVIEKSGLPHKLTAMSTIIEGEWDECMAVVKTCRDELAKDSKRISIQIAIDDRLGATGRLEGKIKSVEVKLGREVSK